jgi:chemotaxis response regulator CheB
MACQLKPDLVTMDIQMPNVDGFTAIQEIMTSTPVPIVVISALTSLSEGEAVARALSYGALTVLQKPSGVHAPDFIRSARDLIAAVKAMAGVKVVRHRPPQRSSVVSSRPLGTRPGTLPCGYDSGLDWRPCGTWVAIASASAEVSGANSSGTAHHRRLRPWIGRLA